MKIIFPINGGANYWNYKGENSIVLLALVDPTCRFFVVDVASYRKTAMMAYLKNWFW